MIVWKDARLPPWAAVWAPDGTFHCASSAWRDAKDPSHQTTKTVARELANGGTDEEEGLSLEEWEQVRHVASHIRHLLGPNRRVW
jgi:hypothetical protein